MTSLRVFLARVRGLFASEARLDEELGAHFEMLAEQFERQGMNREEARFRARRELGAVTQVREAYRGQQRLPFFETLAQDVRFGLRQLSRNKGFAITAILTLMLGIGANTAIFRLLDTVVLRPLPVRNPSGLVIPQGYWNELEQGFSYPLVREMNARQNVVQGIFASGGLNLREIRIGARTITEPMSGTFATGNYFRLIGTEPQLGRFFSESDDKPAAPPVAVISDRFWREQFAGRRDALGATVVINGVPLTIVGVTRPEFFGERVGSYPSLWAPFQLAARLGVPGNLTASMIWLQPMARLRTDVSPVQAQEQLNALWDQLRDYSIQTKDSIRYRLELQPGDQGLDTLHSQFSRSLWILMGIVALVALIASTNLANLLLARATARNQEIGVRLALGAGRQRVIRQLLTESFLLSLTGGALGLLVASLAAHSLVTLASAGDTWQLPLALDGRIAVFALFVTVGATLIFGLAPAAVATRTDLNLTLQAGHRTRSGRRPRQLAARAFVVAQVAFSLMLVAGASLLVRSFWNLTHQEFGFRPDGLLIAQPGGNFRDVFDAEKNRLIYERVRQIPGVQGAAMASPGLLPRGVSILPGPVSVSRGSLPASAKARVMPVSPGYMETMGISVLRGRGIQEEDRKDTLHVAVISASAARAMFGAADPIGQNFSSGNEYSPKTAFTVVGIMNDVRYASPREPFAPMVFVPRSQAPAGTSPTLAIRTAGDPMQFAEAVRQAVHEVAPAITLSRVSTLQDVIQGHARQERLLAWLSGAFGVLALVLAAVGLYGVIAYAAERRTQEIGIRLALGAHPRQVRGLLLREALLLLSIGLVIGGAATLALSKSFSAVLFNLAPNDPATLGLSIAVLAAVAVAAAYLPVRRAAAMDPMAALRQE